MLYYTWDISTDFNMWTLCGSWFELAVKKKKYEKSGIFTHCIVDDIKELFFSFFHYAKEMLYAKEKNKSYTSEIYNNLTSGICFKII